MEWALMVVAIVGIVTWGKVHRARHGVLEDAEGNEVFARPDPEAARLRD